MEDRKRVAMALYLLEKVTPVYERADKSVYTADSKIYGDVILKINQDRVQLKQEYEVLRELCRSEDSAYCKVYAFDETNGLLLEERVLPGTVLREEVSPFLRLQTLKRVFPALHRVTQYENTILQYRMDEIL